jgi:hypothetical protein
VHAVRAWQQVSAQQALARRWDAGQTQQVESRLRVWRGLSPPSPQVPHEQQALARCWDVLRTQQDEPRLRVWRGLSPPSPQAPDEQQALARCWDVLRTQQVESRRRVSQEPSPQARNVLLALTQWQDGERAPQASQLAQDEPGRRTCSLIAPLQQDALQQPGEQHTASLPGRLWQLQRYVATRRRL